MNNHNKHYWANKNPHAIKECQDQRTLKCNVLTGIDDDFR